MTGTSCVAAELAAADLLMRVEARFGRRLRFSTFFNGGSTVAGMAQALIREQSAAADASPALVGLRTSGAHPPICWLPGGSGMSAIPYREVSRLLGPDQPVYALESPVVLDAHGVAAGLFQVQLDQARERLFVIDQQQTLE